MGDSLDQCPPHAIRNRKKSLLLPVGLFNVVIDQGAL